MPGVTEAITLFKHNPSAQRPEILEEITVQREELITKLIDTALDGDELRHQLLVGPRGMGKTHLLSLIASRIRARPKDEIVVAWLDEDAWTIRTYNKLLAEMLGFVGETLDPGLEREAEKLRTNSVGDSEEGEAALREALGERRLLLLVENLDRIFRKIGVEGQARFRDFVDGWGRLLIFGTAPQRFDAVTGEGAPFRDFFEVTELEELTIGSAMELMRKIAKLNRDQELLRYLNDDRAKKRFAAIEALAGGHPRIWLLFAGCISVEAIDDLVPLFLNALDELTPYYQARLAELGDQQQELVVLLSEAGGALSNRALAERSGIAQNQVATMLRQLTEKGYVRPAKVPDELDIGDNRMSFWELREPLMRLCLDVKKSRGEPLRMIIEFLRAWYGVAILDELVRLPAEAELATAYASEAFRILDEEITFANLLRGSPSEVLERAEVALSLRPEPEFQLAKVAALFMKADFLGAKGELEDLVKSAPPGLPKASVNLQLAVARRALGEPVDLESVAEDLRTVQEEAEDLSSAAGFAASVFSLFDLHEDALVAYAKAVELAPDEPQLQAGLGATLEQVGRAEEALQPLAKAVELEPEDFAHHYRFGIALGNLGDHEKALDSFTKATELNPAHAQSHSNRSIALRNLGRDAEALAALDKAVELDPEDAALRDRRARVLDALGRYEEALENFDRAAELDPRNASIHSNRGATFAKMFRWDAAVDAFAAAVEVDPRNPVYRANYGAALQALHRLDEALLALTAASEMEPDSAVFHVRRGLILHGLQRFEEAVAAYGKAIELDPSEAPTWNNRGVSLSSLERFEEALESFTKAAELDPSSATYRGNQGSALGNLERFEEALDALASAVELAPQAADLHARIGYVLDDLDRHEEALAAFAKALDLDPDDSFVHNGQANSLLALGRLPEAEQAARRAIELDPGNSTLRFTLAEAVFASGNFKEGLVALREALAVWEKDGGGDPPGDPDLLCKILWNIRGNQELAEALAAIVAAYVAAGAVDELARGIVSSIPLFIDEDAEESDAEAWVEAWADIQAPGIEIPLSMMRAALAWKRDHDRAHLLELPLEQRQILIDLLAQ